MYIPGSCNIGKQEILKRKRFAMLAVVGTICYAVGIVLIGGSQLFRLALALPATMAILSLQQVGNKFCVAFGLAGIFSFENGLQHIDAAQAEYIKKDKARAVKMIVWSLLGGVAAGVLFMLAPL